MIELSEQAANAMLDTLGDMMSGGTIELLAGDGKRLAALKIANPAAQVAADGALEFNPIGEEDAALAQGQATTARIVAADGSEILQCDIGDMNSDAVIKLNTTQIYRDGPVRLRSFTLAMP